MDSLLEGGEQLERELTPEPVFAPAAGSLLLHAAIAGALVAYGILGGLFHHNFWGSPGMGGAIQVSLVSNALPLPNEHPPNENVLATDKPSEAPAEKAPKAKQAVDETAIPIADKKKPPAKPEPQTAAKAAQKQPPPKVDNKAKFGEQAAASMPRATQAQTASVGPTSISEGDFGSRFGWYVDGINRKMATTWYKPEVDPRTPKGARVYLVFTIRKDGSPKDVQVDRSSGSPTLDRSCMRAVQRVDSFGVLPPAYTSSTLKVSYYCEY
jgi:protein TonB